MSTYFSIRPYTSFEAGLGQEWETHTSSQSGIVSITSGCSGCEYESELRMRGVPSGSYEKNEAWLKLDLTDQKEVELSFIWKNLGDDYDSQDGVYISDDGGSSFTKIYNLGSTSGWDQVTIDLDGKIDLKGLQMSENFVIKFQEYEDFTFPAHGFLFDKIKVDGDIHTNNSITNTARRVRRENFDQSSAGGGDNFGLLAFAGKVYYHSDLYIKKSVWRERVQEKTRVYNPDNGTDYMETINNYRYEDFWHAQLTEKEENNSDGSSRASIYEYAHQKYAGMASDTMLSQVYSLTLKDDSNTDLMKQWQTWDNQMAGGNGAWLAADYWMWAGSGSSAPDDPLAANSVKTAHIQKYDAYGNPIEASDAGGVKTSYLWNEKGDQIFGIFTNAAYDDIQMVAMDGFYSTPYGALAKGAFPYKTTYSDASLAYTSGLEDGISHQKVSITGLTIEGAGLRVSVGSQQSGRKFLIDFEYKVESGRMDVHGKNSSNGVWTTWFSSTPTSGWKTASVELTINTDGTIFFRAPFHGGGYSATVFYLRHIRIYPTEGQAQSVSIDAIFSQPVSMYDVTGNARHFSYDTFGRLVNVYNANGELVTTNNYYYSLESNSSFEPTDPNRVETWRHYDPNNSANVTKSISYLDGLGRQIQSQQRGGNTTIISGTRYNEQGLPEVGSRPIIESNQTSFMSTLFEGSGTFTPGSALSRDSPLRNYYQAQPNGDEAYAYGQLQYEASPLARVSKSTLPGTSHKMGSGKEITATYGLNTIETFATSAQGNTPAKTWGVNTLSKTITEDPDGKKIITYTDGWGQTIAHGVDMNSDGKLTRSSIDLVTEFAYDLRGNVVRVEDPRGLPTTYTYNTLGQLIEKKLPDQEYSVAYKYDDKGRLRFTQDPNHKLQENDLSTSLSGNNTVIKTLVVTNKGVLSYEILIYDLYLDGYNIKIQHVENGNTIVHSNSTDYDDILTGSVVVGPGTYVFYGNTRNTNEPIAGTSGTYSFTPYKFTYTKYDVFDRPVEVGQYAGGVGTIFDNANPNVATFPTSANDAAIKYYYDGYHGDPVTGYTPNNGKSRLTKVSYKDVNSNGWGNDWYSYNSLGVVEWKVSQPYLLNTKKIIKYKYDELGRLTRKDYQPTNPSERFITWNEYDELGRLNYVYTDTDTVVSGREKAAEYQYLADGQVESMSLGGANVPDVYNSYDIRGWLIERNSTLQVSINYEYGFAMNLEYNLNGNIKKQIWQQLGLEKPEEMISYTYIYDKANRLTAANFSGSGYHSKAFDVTNITYDKNGNIKSYIRNNQFGSAGETGYMTMHMQANSNRIAYLEEGANYTQFATDYDANGNMSKNELNGLSSVDYDWRNQPSQLVGNAITMQYAYDGDGNRIKKKKVGGIELHYVRGAGGETLAAYKDDALAFQNIVAGAEIIGTFDGTQRRYFLKDHLGSVRTTVNQNGNVDGYDDYYPFGLTMPGRSSNSANPNDAYKFTGHERDDEANLTLDYMGARNYNPEIGRFLQTDPALEYTSPYTYVGNNPLKLIDPTGMYSRDPREGVERARAGIVSDDPDCPEKPCIQNENQSELYNATQNFNKQLDRTRSHFKQLSKYVSELDIPNWRKYGAKLLLLNYYTRSRAKYDIKIPGQGFSIQELGGQYALYRGEKFRYDDFGNYNFGVAAFALGITLDHAVTGAGFNQIWPGGGKPDFSNFSGAFDDKRDTKMIIRGYYHAFYE